MPNPRGSGGRRERGAGREGRSLGVTLVSDDDLDALAQLFSGRRLAVARTIYMAFARLLPQGREFTRGELADEAGVTTRTFDEYVPYFEEHGYITVERRPDPSGVGNLPNLWTLASPLHLRGEAASPGEADRHTEQPAGATRTKTTAGGSGEGGIELAPELDVPAEMASDAAALLKRKVKVDGQQVKPAEMVIAAAALAQFNRELGSDYGLGANLRPLIMRIRERPSWDAAKHQRLVASAFRIRWWEKTGGRRRASPAVVYGNERVFEQVAQDAAAEARGEAPASDQAIKRRFERTAEPERQR